MDGQTDRQMPRGKTICVPPLKGGDIIKIQTHCRQINQWKNKNKIAYQQFQSRSPQYLRTFGKNTLTFESYHPEMKTWTCHGQITMSNIDKFASQQSQTRSPQYQCTHHVWWKSIDIYSSYHLGMNIWTDIWQTDGQTDGQTNSQRDTIISHHYRAVAGV